MDAAAGRGGSLPVSSSQPHRKEWRAVSQESEPVNLGHSDERTIYEVQEGADFCSMGRAPSDLQQRLQEIARQREGLHQMEVELRARDIARTEILEAQSGFEARIKEHAVAASKVKEQLQEREHCILELEMKLEEKDRELRAVKIDTEAAWAKEDLLREQNKEIATFRRERDNSEAERAQHLQKIHDLQEHIQEKESQFLALEEQHRVAQETILFKDEQLREAQAWITRAQEMEALHSTTNQSLQAELEQFNQYWIGFQRQFADMERHHLQAIQQLQLELAEARDRNEMYKEGSQITHENSIDSSSYIQNKGNQINMNGGGASNGNLGFISIGNLDSSPSFVAASSTSAKTEHVSAVPVVPSSILGMGAYLPPGQMTALHSFVMHPQGVPQSVPSTNPPNPLSPMGHFQPVSTTSVQHWHNEQPIPDISQVPNQGKNQPSHTEQNLLRSDAHYNCQHTAERQVVHLDYLNTSINPHQRSSPVINDSSDGVQVLELNGNQYQVSQGPQEILNANLQFNVSAGHDQPKKKNEHMVLDDNRMAAASQALEQVLTSGPQWAASSVASSTAEIHPVSSSNVAECNDGMQISVSLIPGQAVESTLLDERSLLACIVRAIPAGSDGRIRISTTLPNRLGKMLAPLHWHDYKKYYGKLDDFVACHPELFVIEGDFIHLREGAQEIISATAAYAKVAAAAAASSAPYSSLLPSVAVTPVAQNHRLKRAPSVDSKPTNTMLSAEGATVTNPVDSFDGRSHNSKLHNQQLNGVSFNIVRGFADLKVSGKTKDLQGQNGLLSETRPNHSSVHATVGNGAPSQTKGLSNGRHGFGAKHQGRSTEAGLISRRQN